MKRVLITGGSGFLGARILQQGLGDAELCSLPRGFLAAAGEAEVTETIQKLQPAAIVHAAALSDTGYCAQHPEEAHRANVELPVWVGCIMHLQIHLQILFRRRMKIIRWR